MSSVSVHSILNGGDHRLSGLRLGRWLVTSDCVQYRANTAGPHIGIYRAVYTYTYHGHEAVASKADRIVCLLLNL